MRRLPIIHPESSFATAISISADQLVLEPVPILNGEWCVRRGGRLVPIQPEDADAFILPDRTIDDGVGLWKRLGHFLRDREVFVPGDGTTLATAEQAGHWRRIAIPLEPRQGDNCDTGIEATLARGVERKEAA